MNVEGKIFSLSWRRGSQNNMMFNQYVDISVQKGGIPGIPGCIEHASMIWEAIQSAKRGQLSLYVVWLDLANACELVNTSSYKRHWRPITTTARYPYPSGIFYDAVFHQDVYYKVDFSLFFFYEVRIVMGCTISTSMFVLAMEILLKAAESNIPEKHIGKGMHMPPIKAFMDDTTLVMNRK